MKCEHRLENICQLASSIIGMSAETNNQACQVCLTCATPKQLNLVTASLAVRALPKPVAPEYRYLLTKLDFPSVGTELERLISWFPTSRTRNCSRCKNLKAKMNRWGPDRCEKKIQYIVKQMEKTAMQNKIPFSAFIVEVLIRKAIRNVRKSWNGQ